MAYIFFTRFEGRWEACSVFDAVEAPLGEEVFGGKPVLSAAEKDLTSKLSYPVLFKNYEVISEQKHLTGWLLNERWHWSHNAWELM